MLTTNRLYAPFIARELEQARALGYQSFSGVWKTIMRNPYAEGSPCREEYQIGRENRQFDRPAVQVKDAAFAPRFVYRTDDRGVA